MQHNNSTDRDFEKSDSHTNSSTSAEKFWEMSDQERLSLFMKRINSQEPSEYDELLKSWWANRY